MLVTGLLIEVVARPARSALVVACARGHFKSGDILPGLEADGPFTPDGYFGGIVFLLAPIVLAL